MPSTHIVKDTTIEETARVKQLCGMFDLSPDQGQREEWSVDFELPEEWNIGLIVGPSGSGKTVVANDLFPDQIVDGYKWPPDKSIVDAFPDRMSIKEVTKLLSSVGFSSPPTWLRPFRVLSNGEQFRAMIARAMAEQPELCVIDEFTSVIDRTVAKIGSSAVQKAVRRRDQQFVAVTCHYDVVDWLEPDWVYEPHTSRLARDCLQRPEVEIRVRRVHHDAWRLFREHHYLSHSISPLSYCFCGFVNEEPAAFIAVMSFPHPHRPTWRVHRVVCRPAYQGIGIGNALTEYVCGLFRATGKPVSIVTSHPAMVHSYARSKKWDMRRKPSRAERSKSTHDMEKTKSVSRITAGFEYKGKPKPEDALAFGILDELPRSAQSQQPTLNGQQ